MKRFPLFTKLLFGLFILAGLTIGAIRATPNNSKQYLWVLLSVIFLLAIWFGSKLIRLFRPLKQLEQGLRQLSDGEITRELIPINGSDEVNNVIREYNRMMKSLEERDRQWKESRTAYQKLQGEMLSLRFVTGHSENILNSVTLGIFVMTKGEIVSLTNSAFKELLQVSTEIAGLPLKSIPFIMEQEVWVKGIREVLKKGEKKIISPMKVGDRVLQLLITPLYDHMETNLTIGGIITLVEDISEKILMEERLLQSERLATVGKLAAQVAHEIRNPLNSIGLNTDYLLDKISKIKNLSFEDTSPLLNAIREQVDHLESVTEQYLQMTRSPQPNPREVSLIDLLNEVDILIRPQYHFKGVNLRFENPKEAPLLYVDAGQIRQALLNLLTNALDVSHEGQTVMVSLQLSEKGVEFSVTDEGPGIPSESLEKIFLPFYTTKKEGVGLGLALTKQIVSAHNGDLRCASNPGNGTIFTIELPLSHF